MAFHWWAGDSGVVFADQCHLLITVANSLDPDQSIQLEIYLHHAFLHLAAHPVRMDIQTCKSPNTMLSLFFLQCSIQSMLSVLSNLYLKCVIAVVWLYCVFCVSSSQCHATNGTTRKGHRTQSGLWSVIVVFHDHTHLLFYYLHCIGNMK